jgi:Ca2+:H+ antiporter
MMARVAAFVRRPLNWLLVLVPVSIVADVGIHADLFTFVMAVGAIIPLAGLIGQATEQLAVHAGPRIGGLLNATFGNLTELIVAVFLILRGEFVVVKASLIGSILGNLLLVLGLSLIAGGARHREQSFNAGAAGVHATSLLLAVVGLLMPALFGLTEHGETFLQREVVSGVVAAVLILLYAAALIFTLVTHAHLFHTPAEDETASWSLRTSVLVLVGAAALVALESELLVGTLEPAIEALGVSKLFVGLIVVPVVGNAAEHASAVSFALRNKLDVTLEIAVGSSTQIALFVAPALVFISLAVGKPMDFLFSPFEIAAVALATMIVSFVSLDGRSNWLEGVQLVGAYAIMAISFFFLGTHVPGG